GRAFARDLGGWAGGRVPPPQAEGRGVDPAAGGGPQPVEPLLVLLVGRVAEDLQQLPVPPDPAAVLGRAGAATTGTPRVRHLRFGDEHVLHQDVVLPVVAEVVGVAQPVAGP